MCRRSGLLGNGSAPETQGQGLTLVLVALALAGDRRDCQRQKPEIYMDPYRSSSLDPKGAEACAGGHIGLRATDDGGGPTHFVFQRG